MEVLEPVVALPATRLDHREAAGEEVVAVPWSGGTRGLALEHRRAQRARRRCSSQAPGADVGTSMRSGGQPPAVAEDPVLRGLCFEAFAVIHHASIRTSKVVFQLIDRASQTAAEAVPRGRQRLRGGAPARHAAGAGQPASAELLRP